MQNLGVVHFPACMLYSRLSSCVHPSGVKSCHQKCTSKITNVHQKSKMIIKNVKNVLLSAVQAVYVPLLHVIRLVT